MTALMNLAFTLLAATATWTSVDDVVMGGRSESHAIVTSDSTLLFTGVVSLENDGGFASIRSALQSHDLGAADGIVLRVRGDGRRYRVSLRTDGPDGGVQYQAGFEAPAARWLEVSLPFAGFEARFRGRAVPDAPALDPARIRSFGLMVADRQAGPFRLEIDTVRGYAGGRP